MYRAILFCLFCFLLAMIDYHCAPSLRSAKIQSGLSIDGVLLPALVTTNATDEQGNDVTDETEPDHYITFDMKFRYGWERKNKLGFELVGGLDGEMGAYLELPGTNTFHWGIGGETNMALLALSLDVDKENVDEISEFISHNNYNFYLMGGYFPNSNKEISLGIKYQPFLKELLKKASKEDIDPGNTLPITFLIDGRYRFSKHFGMIGGSELYYLNFTGKGKEAARIIGGYFYLGLTYF
jgi:hypothetical protein